MIYCTHCGKEIADETIICPHCARGTSKAYQHKESRRGPIQILAILFMSFGCISFGTLSIIIWIFDAFMKNDSALITLFFIICMLASLGWTVPMTINYFKKSNVGQYVDNSFKICTILFVSPVAGILLLFDKEGEYSAMSYNSSEKGINAQAETTPNKGLQITIKVFMFLGVMGGRLLAFDKLMEKYGVTTLNPVVILLVVLIPLAWCIPMIIHYFTATKRDEIIGTGFKVCTMIFVNFIAGILMLCDNHN